MCLPAANSLLLLTSRLVGIGSAWYKDALRIGFPLQTHSFCSRVDWLKLAVHGIRTP